jgi:hypothetical protein
MSKDDLAYFARRAEAERANAEMAADPGIARLHGEMAQRYQDIVDGKTEPKLHTSS